MDLTVKLSLIGTSLASEKLIGISPEVLITFFGSGRNLSKKNNNINNPPNTVSIYNAEGEQGEKITIIEEGNVGFSDAELVVVSIRKKGLRKQRYLTTILLCVDMVKH